MDTVHEIAFKSFLYRILSLKFPFLLLLMRSFVFKAHIKVLQEFDPFPNIWLKLVHCHVKSSYIFHCSAVVVLWSIIKLLSYLLISL